MQVLKALYFIFAVCVPISAQAACIGCTNAVSSQGITAASNGSPKRSAASVQDAKFCRTSAPYCLVANARTRKLSLYNNRRGVIAWDIIMRSPGRVMRGYIDRIILNPLWCPPASVRRKYPGLPKGCIPPGHPQNAMGDVKITLSGDFAGTAIRIHDTRGFGPSWPNEDSSGCVRVLNLRKELLPRIAYGKARVEVVFLP